MTHTELPWAIHIDEDGNPVDVYAENGRRSIARFSVNNPDRKADAAFLDKACNSHDELVETLKEAIGIIKIFHGPVAWDIYEKQSPEMKRFSALLVKAEGRTS